jgi:hypothetical protein
MASNLGTPDGGTQPDRSKGENVLYWQAVANDLAKQGVSHPKVPPFGNWQVLGEAGPQPPAPKLSPKDAFGKKTKTDK